MALKNKEEELNLIILELRKSLASLQEKLAKEESEKKVRRAIFSFFFSSPICFILRLFIVYFCVWKVITSFECDNQAAVDSLAKEKEARVSIERSQASLSEELDKGQGELDSANQRVNIRMKN